MPYRVTADTGFETWKLSKFEFVRTAFAVEVVSHV